MLGMQYCSLLLRVNILDMYTIAEELELITEDKAQLTPKVGQLIHGAFCAAKLHVQGAAAQNEPSYSHPT